MAAAPLRRGASLVRLGLARRFFDGEEFVGALVVMPGDDDIHRSRFRFGTACWRPFCCHLHEHGADREARVAKLAAFWAERLAASPLGQPADPSISSEPADSDVDAGAAASQRSQRARLRIRRQQRQRRRRRLWRDLAPRMAMLEAGLQRVPPAAVGLLPQMAPLRARAWEKMLAPPLVPISAWLRRRCMVVVLLSRAQMALGGMARESRVRKGPARQRWQLNSQPKARMTTRLVIFGRVLLS